MSKKEKMVGTDTKSNFSNIAIPINRVITKTCRLIRFE